jgi:hypothetical protein
MAAPKKALAQDARRDMHKELATAAAALKHQLGEAFGKNMTSVHSATLSRTNTVHTDIRFRVDPGDVPTEKAARRLHLTAARFAELLPDLIARGFPPADPDTGMYDLEAIDLWRKNRHPPGAELTSRSAGLQHVSDAPSMTERFLAAKDRQAQTRRRHRGPS